MPKKTETVKKFILPVDLYAEYRQIQREISRALSRVFRSGRFILGAEVENFEKELAIFLGTKFVIGVASGTDALTIALKTLRLGAGDEVILPANVYPSAFGVALSGVKLRLADVDPATLNVSVETIKKALTSKTKAVVVVHLYGNPAPVGPIKKLLKQQKVYLVEDCAQAAGATFQDRRVGTFGDLACFSFYPTKNLSAYGDGGAVVTSKPQFARRSKLLRMYGEVSRYHSVLLGHNSRLDEIQAAILKTKLKYLDGWNRKRRKLAKLYKNELVDLPLTLPEETPGSKSIYHLFVIRSKKRDRLATFLQSRGVATGVHYPTPIHLVPTFSSLGYGKGSLPVSEQASKEVLSLPLYPQLTRIQVRHITSLIREFFVKVNKSVKMTV